MQRAILALGVGALLLTSSTAHALSVLMRVTPDKLEQAKMRITSKAARNNTVEFVIRRDIRGIDWPGRAAYLSDSRKEAKSLGTRLKLEEEKDKTLTYRFSVPQDRVADSVFTLWGGGEVGEGVTFQLRLADFRKPKAEKNEEGGE